MIRKLLLATLFAACAFGQDYRSAEWTAPISTRDTTPGVCRLGQLFIRSDQTAGQNLYVCGSHNDWSLVGASSGSSLTIPDPSGAVLFNNAGALGGTQNALLYPTALATASAPILTLHGTPGTTTYGYEVIALNAVGHGPISTETLITTGPATLDGTNYITVSTAAVAHATSCLVFRTTDHGGFLSAFSGEVGAVACGSSINDTLGPNTGVYPPAPDASISNGLYISGALSSNYTNWGDSTLFYTSPLSQITWPAYKPPPAFFYTSKTLSDSDFATISNGAAALDNFVAPSTLTADYSLIGHETRVVNEWAGSSGNSLVSGQFITTGNFAGSVDQATLNIQVTDDSPQGSNHAQALVVHGSFGSLGFPTGTTSHYYGVRAFAPFMSGASHVNEAQIFRADNQVGGTGSVDTLTGMQIDDFTGLATNIYGVHQLGATELNVFEGKLIVALHTPASSSEACIAGQFSDDASFHYVCTSTNTWKRVALSTF